MNEHEAQQLHKQLRQQLKEVISTGINLLEAIGERPTLVSLFGSIATELHDILKDALEAKKGRK